MFATYALALLSVMLAIVGVVVIGKDQQTQTQTQASSLVNTTHPSSTVFILCHFYPKTNDHAMTYVNSVTVQVLNEEQLEEYRLQQFKECQGFWNIDLTEPSYNVNATPQDEDEDEEEEEEVFEDEEDEEVFEDEEDEDEEDEEVFEDEEEEEVFEDEEEEDDHDEDQLDAESVDVHDEEDFYEENVARTESTSEQPVIENHLRKEE
jgi:hypothetical protein